MIWTRTRLKHLCTDPGQYGLNISADQYSSSGARLIRTSDIDNSGNLKLNTEGVFVDIPLEERYLLKPGDLLLSRSGTLGRSFLVPNLPSRSTFAGYLVRFRPQAGVDPRYLAYAATSTPFQDVIRSEAVSSTIQNFNAERYANIPLDAPPLEEQRRIADFLDTETGRIRKLESMHRGQIGLLSERGNSRILAAVRGENESGTRVDSMLKWLGSVPPDWPIASVGSQFDVQLGKMLNKERTSGDHLKVYLRNTNVQWDRVDTDDLLMMDFPPSERTRYEVRSGDLLICEGGEPGRAAIWDGRIAEIYYQKALHRARSLGKSSVRWLYYCLKAATALNVFAIEGNTTTIAHLTGEQLRAHRFPFPDRAVQDRITIKLDAQEHTDRQLVQKLEAQIALLAERRQALITATVTGQMDVTTARGLG